MSLLGKAHQSLVLNRRVSVLVDHLVAVVPAGASVLDVGCGDGKITACLAERRPDLTMQGVDVLVRDDCAVPVKEFDGVHLPYENQSFDCVVFVDVLHHTEDPLAMLREATRVTRRHLVIKDHLRKGLLAHTTLRFMDYVGNARHGVALPYNYWKPAQWDDAFAELKLQRQQWRTQLGLYQWPASMVFERSLHFVARLALPESDANQHTSK